MGIAYTFRPDNRFNVKSYSYSDFLYNIHKKYKYPSLRVRYSISKKIIPNLETGLETGITFRYMEPSGNGHTTYYSFPLAVNSTYRLLSLNKDKKLFTSMRLGYHFKHPRYKYIDGMGGAIGSIDVGIKNIPRSVSYKFGYEIQQDRSFFKMKNYLNTSSEEVLVKFNQYVSQVYFSAIISLR